MSSKKPGVIDLNIKADELGLQFEKMGQVAEEQFNQAVSDVAHMIHANIVAKAASELSGLRQDYLKGLTFDKVGDNSYVIGLAGEWANKVEDGFAAYDMKAALLSSNANVEVGSRAGQPWVQQSKSKDKHKFAHVPFEHKPFAKEGKAQNLAQAIKQLQARNADGAQQKMTQVFKSPSGRPLQGKVATVGTAQVGGKHLKDLDGLVKYQKTYKNKSGKETTQSVYMTFRTISEVGTGWKHPGFDGLKAFPEAEQAAEQAIEQIMKKFLG